MLTRSPNVRSSHMASLAGRGTGTWLVTAACVKTIAHFAWTASSRSSTSEPFERDENFDCRAYIVEHYGRTSGSFDIKIEFQVPSSMVRQKIPASYGSLTATTRGGTLLSTQYDDLDNMARYLMI